MKYLTVLAMFVCFGVQAEVVKPEPIKKDLVKYNLFGQDCYINPKTLIADIQKVSDGYSIIGEEFHIKIRNFKSGKEVQNYKKHIEKTFPHRMKYLLKTKHEKLGYYNFHYKMIKGKMLLAYYTELKNSNIVEVSLEYQKDFDKLYKQGSYKADASIYILYNFINEEFMKKIYQVTPAEKYREKQYRVTSSELIEVHSIGNKKAIKNQKH